MYQFINYKKVSKIIFVFLFFFILNTPVNSIERSKKEVKIGVFLEDYKKFGKFKKINASPIGMFPETADNFSKKQVIAQKKFIQTFITKRDKWIKTLPMLFWEWDTLNFFICNN